MLKKLASLLILASLFTIPAFAKRDDDDRHHDRDRDRHHYRHHHHKHHKHHHKKHVEVW